MSSHPTGYVPYLLCGGDTSAILFGDYQQMHDWSRLQVGNTLRNYSPFHYYMGLEFTAINVSFLMWYMWVIHQNNSLKTLTFFTITDFVDLSLDFEISTKCMFYKTVCLATMSCFHGNRNCGNTSVQYLETCVCSWFVLYIIFFNMSFCYRLICFFCYIIVSTKLYTPVQMLLPLECVLKEKLCEEVYIYDYIIECVLLHKALLLYIT